MPHTISYFFFINFNTFSLITYFVILQKKKNLKKNKNKNLILLMCFPFNFERKKNSADF
jgi:hypothetical protein